MLHNDYQHQEFNLWLIHQKGPLSNITLSVRKPENFLYILYYDFKGPMTFVHPPSRMKHCELPLSISGELFLKEH